MIRSLYMYVNPQHCIRQEVYVMLIVKYMLLLLHYTKQSVGNLHYLTYQTLEDHLAY